MPKMPATYKGKSTKLGMGGRSRDGSTVYIDSRIGKNLSADGTKFDPAKTLPAHEIAEWYCMHKLGMKYEDAHRVATWNFEKPRVEAWGLDWRAYQKLWEKLAAPNDIEKIDNPPPDADLAPYEEVGTKEQVKAMKVKGARENRLMKAGA